VEPAVAAVHALVVREQIGSPLALFLTGSACDGGLRPDSDVDLLLITRRSLAHDERATLLGLLLEVSGRRATRKPGRPVELISLVLDDVRPWHYPAVRDFEYGEWLRDEYVAGHVPRPDTDPNLPVLLTSARAHSVALLGPPLTDLVDPVPSADLVASIFDALPDLLEGLVGDERNVLLTLARMVVTLRSGRIVAKDVAVEEVVPGMGAPHARLLGVAAAGYRGEVDVDWDSLVSEVVETAEALVSVIETLRPVR